MFYLHCSPKAEHLVNHLGKCLQDKPLTSPLAAEYVLVQQPGMERWLAQQLASHLRVWANFKCVAPTPFLGELAQRLLIDTSPAIYDPEISVWLLEGLLRQIDESHYWPLQQYLQGAEGDLKRWQLAQQICQLFTQYQSQRPDLLDAWQQGQVIYPGNVAERWQAALWLRLLASVGWVSRSSLWQTAIQTLKAYPPGHWGAELPERLSLFGLNNLSPLLLEYLHAVSLHCDVHCYLLTPQPLSWLTDAPINAELGHPLIKALGGQGKELQSLLQQISLVLDVDSWQAEQPLTRLQRLQHDLWHNCCQPETLTDDSISVHACHSRLREVEVLKNLLLHALEQDSHLELREMVVMAPDIEAYAPFIAAVFSDVQHTIADRSLRSSNNVLDVFIRFLQLTQSRLGWQSVLDILEQPVVYASFDLKESDLDLLRHWLQATQVRWGQSAAHKEELGLPGSAQNTWQASLERLLIGYSVGSEQKFVLDILPFSDIEGGNAQALGGLHDFLQLVFSARLALGQAQTLTHWQQVLRSYADTLLSAAPVLQRQPLYALLTTLVEKIAPLHQALVAPAVVINWLETQMREQTSNNGFLRGQLTFCSLLPMRVLPFKVVALLGMHEGQFPRVDRPPSFDLSTIEQRLGDYSRRAEDRYQFLEILLSVRQQLIITYLGQSITDNAAIPPAVVVSELLDVLQQHYRWQITGVKHPLQAFSARYFNGGAELFSYAEADCSAANALQQPRLQPQSWWSGQISVTHEPVVELAELLKFYQHPQKYFVQQQLDLRVRRLDEVADECEPFKLDTLAQYALQQQWIGACLQGDTLSLAKLQAEGKWLVGALGEVEFARQERELKAFVARIQELALGAALAPQAIDVTLAANRIVGTIKQRFTHGCLHYRYAKLKGKDFFSAWLQHTLINQISPCNTYLLSKDAEVVFLPEHASLTQLEDWLRFYQQGLTTPTAFFVEAAFAYFVQVAKPKNTKTLQEIVVKCLSDALAQEFELELRQLFQRQTDLAGLLSPEFEAYCRGATVPDIQFVSDDAKVF